MTKCAFIPNFLKFYNILWQAALPFLKRNRRLSPTFERRVCPQLAPADIWIQAASAGEAFLALSIISRLGVSLEPVMAAGPAPQTPIRVLVTTTTDQGMEVLCQGLDRLEPNPHVLIKTDLFPFDLKAAVKQAADQVRPKAVVLLETEIWPTFLFEMKQRKIPVIILNARMSERSGRRYKITRAFWQCLAPDRILAISEQDRQRYRAVFPPTPSAVMHNIKFDMLDNEEEKECALPAQTGRSDLSQLFARNLPLSVIASFRRQEEKEIMALVLALRDRIPEQIIALFPRHMHRIPTLKQRLTRLGIPFRLRSELTGPVTRPEVILWDRFGELRLAYCLAATVFVGGSLRPLGGQNFIEPVVLGIPTVIGPFWNDFAWAGDAIFSLGVVTSVPDAHRAAEMMATHLTIPQDIPQNKKKARAYIAARSGGSAAACRAILEAVTFDDSPAFFP